MFKYFNRALKVMDILGNTIPKALNDGTITVAECVEVVRQLFVAFDVKSFQVPEKIQEVAIKVDEVVPDGLGQ
jgi:hypothetical protein